MEAPWTQERVVERFRAHYAATGVTPRYVEAGTNGLPGYRTVARLCGSWTAAQAAADLPVRPGAGKGATMPPDEIVVALQDFKRRSGRAPTSTDLDTAGNGLPHSQTVVRGFGSVAGALQAAGIRPLRRPQRQWTPDDAVAEIRAFARRTGNPPRVDDSRDRNSGLPSQGVVTRLFGNWNAGLVAAGFNGRTGRPLGSPNRQPVTVISNEGADVSGLLVDRNAWPRLAQRVAAKARVQLADAEDALQDAWIALAGRDTAHPEPVGFMVTAAKRNAQMGRRSSARRDSLDARREAYGDWGAPHFDPSDQLDARMQLVDLLAGRDLVAVA